MILLPRDRCNLRSVLIWLAAVGSVIPCGARTRVSLPTVEIKMPAVTFPEVVVPANTPPASPEFRSMRMMGGCCTRVVPFCGGVIWNVRDYTPDACAALTLAFRDASHVELWRLQRTVDRNLPATPLLANYRYRESIITAFRRDRDLTSMGQVLQILMSACAAAEPDPILEDRGLRPTALEESLNARAFAPDLVVTFNGANPVRLEIEFSCGETLIRMKESYGWLTLDRRDILALRALADSLRLPADPRIVPATQFAGI